MFTQLVKAKVREVRDPPKSHNESKIKTGTSLPPACGQFHIKGWLNFLSHWEWGPRLGSTFPWCAYLFFKAQPVALVLTTPSMPSRHYHLVSPQPTELVCILPTFTSSSSMRTLAWGLKFLLYLSIRAAGCRSWMGRFEESMGRKVSRWGPLKL